MNRHILILTPSFTSSDDDTVVPPLTLYVKNWLVNYPNDKISIITIHYPFTNLPFELFGAQIYPMGAANSSIFKRLPFWRSALTTAQNINRFHPIDIVHSFWINEPALLGNRISKKWNIPHICTAMGQDVLPSNKYLRLVKIECLRMVTLSAFQQRTLKKNKGADSQVIPWGVDVTEHPEPINQNREIDLICVSSLIPLKRVELFIDLVAELTKNNPLLRALIVGGGKLEAHLKNKIRELQLEDNILCMGELPRIECLRLMQKSKALIHTSKYESQGFVLNEALAQGCQVFALSLGLEIQDPKFTIVSDLPEMINYVSRFLNRKEHSFRAVIPFDIQNTIESYRELYDSIR